MQFASLLPSTTSPLEPQVSLQLASQSGLFVKISAAFHEGVLQRGQTLAPDLATAERFVVQNSEAQKRDSSGQVLRAFGGQIEHLPSLLFLQMLLSSLRAGSF